MFYKYKPFEARALLSISCRHKHINADSVICNIHDFRFPNKASKQLYEITEDSNWIRFMQKRKMFV